MICIGGGADNALGLTQLNGGAGRERAYFVPNCVSPTRNAGSEDFGVIRAGVD